MLNYLLTITLVIVVGVLAMMIFIDCQANKEIRRWRRELNNETAAREIERTSDDSATIQPICGRRSEDHKISYNDYG